MMPFGSAAALQTVFLHVIYWVGKLVYRGDCEAIINVMITLVQRTIRTTHTQFE
jgi:hypothetical protein